MPCASCGHADITCCMVLGACAPGRGSYLSEFVCLACKTMLARACLLRPDGHVTRSELYAFPPFLSVSEEYVQKLYSEVN